MIANVAYLTIPIYIYITAANKAIALKDQADEYDIEHFKRMLEEWEDEEILKLL